MGSWRHYIYAGVLALALRIALQIVNNYWLQITDTKHVDVTAMGSVSETGSGNRLPLISNLGNISSMEIHLNHLLEKESSIRRGKFVIPTTTVLTGMKASKISYPIISLGDRFTGWLSDPSLRIINVDKYTREKILHGFVLSLHLAFAKDNEFTITPDDIWLMIAQGFSQHINMNPEKYRNQFVNFEGKRTITVRRDSYGPDVKNNSWNDCFPDFAVEISKLIGEQNVALVMDEFTTTTVTSTMAMQVVLMDMVKHYLDYTVITLCGIPKFYIKGSEEDWSRILKNIQIYRKFELDWWVDRLEEFLRKMHNIVCGKNESDWLNSFYKYESGSGEHPISGHILKLFPYLKNDTGHFVENHAKHGEEVDIDSLPSGQTHVPFIWQYLEEERELTFRTFSVPVVEGESIAVKPVVQVVERV